MPELDGKDVAPSSSNSSNSSFPLSKLAEVNTNLAKEAGGLAVEVLKLVVDLQVMLNNERRAHIETQNKLIEQMEKRLALQRDVVRMQQAMVKMGVRVPKAEAEGVLDGKD